MNKSKYDRNMTAETKALNQRQREILVENHGSLAAAELHIAKIDALIPLAMRKSEAGAAQRAISRKRVYGVNKEGEQFVLHRQVTAYHRFMNKMKKNEGLI